MTSPAGIERVLFTEEQVSARIKEVAAAISEKYRGRELKLIAVLKRRGLFSDGAGAGDRNSSEIDFPWRSLLSAEADVLERRDGAHRQGSG